MRTGQSVVGKAAAGFFATLFLIGAVGLTLLTAVGYAINLGTSSYLYIETEVLRPLVRSQLYEAMDVWHRGDDPAQVYENTNLIFRMTDENGNVLSESANAILLTEDAYQISSWWEVYEGESTEEGENEIVDRASTDGWREVRITVCGDVDRAFPHTDFYSVLLPLVRAYYAMFAYLPLLALGCAAVWLFLTVFLLRAAGYRRGEDAPVCGWREHIPLDLWAFGLLLFVCLHDAVFEAVGRGGTLTGQCILIALVVFADAALVMETLTTLAVRIKTHTLLSSTLIWAVCRLAWRMLSFVWRGIVRMLRLAVGGVPLVWRTAILVGLNAVADLCLIAVRRNSSEAFWLVVLKDVLLGAAILFSAVLMRRIRACGARLAAGDLTAKIDTRGMFGDFRSFSEDMNRLGDGMSVAVEERLKSERFRTELITNVSHDIRTPLTSIVNYVDLMEKEHIETEPLAGYIRVLKRQSARLKKLTDDLIEASKAASGAISVQMEPLDVTVLLDQAAGEYDEKLRAAGLDLIVRQPEEAVIAMADGRLMWRVVDNLMQNIVKYALSGTRVYLSLRVVGSEAEIVFRNIARDELRMDSEDLLRRFTRADASRSSEGSGLGLSIANSLTVLQHGTLTLHVDGDLFKVTLLLPLADGK